LKYIVNIILGGDIQVHGSEDFEGEIGKSSWHMRKDGSPGRRMREVLFSNIVI
jgi:hypothetical protein